MKELQEIGILAIEIEKRFKIPEMPPYRPYERPENGAMREVEVIDCITLKYLRNK